MTIDEFFRREWLRHVFELAVDDLRTRLTTTGRNVRWTVFERHDLGAEPGAMRPSYGQLAGEVHLPVTQVTNYLAAARRELRVLVLSRLRELCATDTEFRDEARELLGRALE